MASSTPITTVNDEDQRNGDSIGSFTSSPSLSRRYSSASPVSPQSSGSRYSQESQGQGSKSFRYNCDTVRQAFAGPTVSNLLIIHNSFQQPGNYNVQLSLQGDMLRPWDGSLNTMAAAVGRTSRSPRSVSSQSQRLQTPEQKVKGVNPISSPKTIPQ